MKCFSTISAKIIHFCLIASCFFNLFALLCSDFWFLNGVMIMNKVKNFFKRYVLAGLIALGARNGIAANNGTVSTDKAIAATDTTISNFLTFIKSFFCLSFFISNHKYK